MLHFRFPVAFIIKAGLYWTIPADLGVFVEGVLLAEDTSPSESCADLLGVFAGVLLRLRIPTGAGCSATGRLLACRTPAVPLRLKAPTAAWSKLRLAISGDQHLAALQTRSKYSTGHLGDYQASAKQSVYSAKNVTFLFQMGEVEPAKR